MNKMKFDMAANVRSEVFSTCRLGKKWKTRITKDGAKVALLDAEGSSLGTGEVTDMWCGPLGQVPAIFLESYHDPIGRCWSGLQCLMQGHYNKFVGDTEEVTLLRVRYTGSLIQVAGAGDMPKAGGTMGGMG